MGFFPGRLCRGDGVRGQWGILSYIPQLYLRVSIHRLLSTIAYKHAGKRTQRG